MRQFNLNGNPIDLANSKRVMGVRPCFRKVERGVHFDGYSYATYGNYLFIISKVIKNLTQSKIEIFVLHLYTKYRHLCVFSQLNFLK